MAIAMLITSLLLLHQHVTAQEQTKWVTPPEEAAVKNPEEHNTALLPEAHKLYVSLCSQCHGYKGKGDGPVAGVLKIRPADHSSQAIQSETDGSLYWKLSTGKGQMQPYKANLTDVQRWALVNYIRTLKGN